MDQTLRQLGELLLGAVPTVLLLATLYILYTFLVHRPLTAVLAERRARTQGAMEKARADIAAVEARTADYEQRLREARQKLFKSQEARRQQANQSRSQAVLGQFPGAPVALLASMEADVYPRNKPDLADLVDGSIGEGSFFHERFGYYAQGVGPQTELVAGDLHVDPLTRRVRRGARHITLAPREFKLLEYLMRHADQVVTRTMLLENVWDIHFDPQTNVIDVHISKLRQKIDADFERPLLRTVRNAGYMLTAAD